MDTKKLYLIIGVLLGVVGVLVVGNLEPEPAMAQGYQSSGPANGFIALTATTRSEDAILWLIDTRKKVLLTYALAENQPRARLTAIRDIQYELDVPDGMYYPASSNKRTEPSPTDIKKMIEDAKKRAGE